MVRREAFINKIREIGFAYKTTQKRTFLYKKSGTTDYISVPKADLLEDEFVTHSLRQHGCSKEEIERFIASAKS
jgi:hypothetical protein